jgi:MerR family mercuric resistance operon transcriptional regulator
MPVIATGSSAVLIGELSKEFGCPVESIRYYEKIGLLPPARRCPNGYRDYDDQHRNFLRFIIRTKKLGFTQDEVRRLTDLARQSRPACSTVYEILERQSAELRQRITELRKMESALKRLKRQCCEGELRVCPVIEELMG